MNDRLLELGMTPTMENLVRRINEVIGEKFSVLDNPDDIEKWNMIPRMFLLDDNIQSKILEFVEYMDTLFIPVENKAMFVISLAGMIEFTNLNIMNYHTGDLFLLADYYQNSSIHEIQNTLYITGNLDLLMAIRKTVLDLDIRKKLLSGFVNQVISVKIDHTKPQELSNLIQEYIKKLESSNFDIYAN